MSLIILGEKYHFDDLEFIKVNKKFKKIDSIKYKNRDSREVRKDIESLLKQSFYKYLVINTKVYVDPKMIKYLTLLQFRLQKRKIQIITIENFLEKFLYKCYIPDDNSDLKFLADIRPYNKFEFCLKKIIDYTGVSILFLVHFLLNFL